MAIEGIVIDTNAYAAFKKGERTALFIIQNIKEIIITPILIGELIGGFMLGDREQKNRQELIQFLNVTNVNQVNIGPQTSEYFATIFKDLRTKGTPIPTNDIWIAATAFEYNLAVYTFDKHFHNITGLKVVSSSSDLG